MDTRLTRLLMTAIAACALCAGEAGPTVSATQPVSSAERHGEYKKLSGDGILMVSRFDKGEPVGAVVARPATGNGEWWRAEYPKRRSVAEAALRRLTPAFLSPIAFESAPAIAPTYVAGVIDREVTVEALDILNAYRCLANVKDDITIDDAYNDLSQHGAVILATLNRLDHTPSKPSDMPQAFYDKAYKSTSSSNLHGYLHSHLQPSLHSYMWDSDPSNATRVGHRRWCINPEMSKTGFGSCNGFAVMYAHDRARRGDDWSHVTWPASGWNGSSIFPNGTSWSVQFNPKKWGTPDAKTVQIRIWRLNSDFVAVGGVLPNTVLLADGGPGNQWPAIVFRPRLNPHLRIIKPDSGDQDEDGGSSNKKPPTTQVDWLGWPAGESVYRIEIGGLRSPTGQAQPLNWISHFIPQPKRTAEDVALGEARKVAFAKRSAARTAASATAAAIAATATKAAPVVAAIVKPDLSKPSSWPTQPELAQLALINEFRADPAATAKAMTPQDGLRHPGLGVQVDWALFNKDTAALPAVPPMIMDLTLLASARNHAAYLRLHQVLAHQEIEGRPRFTGEDPGDRARAMGWTDSWVGENCAGPINGAWNTHLSYIVDWTKDNTGGVGGMQYPPGHRLALASRHSTVVGVGVDIESDTKLWWTVHNMSAARVAPNRRLIGGVIYTDINRNRRYDVGEGLDGITMRFISASGTSAIVPDLTAWPAGGFSSTVPSHHELIAITMRNGNEIARQGIAAGGTPAWINQPIADPAQLSLVDACLLQLGSGRLGSAQRRPVLTRLCMLARGLSCDAVRSASIAAIIDAVPLAERADLFQDRILAMIANGRFSDAISTASTSTNAWSGSDMSPWLSQAQQVAAAALAIKGIFKAAEDRTPIEQSQMNDATTKATALTTISDPLLEPWATRYRTMFALVSLRKR